MCYWFDADLVAYPEYYLDVLYLQQFLFLDGRNQTSTASIAVNGHNKYAIPTTIPDMAELSHQQEKIKFVAADEDCHADRPVFSLDATGKFVINDDGSMPLEGTLCFQFEEEDFYRYEEYSLTMLQLLQFVAQQGSNYRVVSNHPKVLSLDCPHCTEEAIYFTATRGACEGEFDPYFQFNLALLSGLPTFTFNPKSPEVKRPGVYGVCYRFAQYWDVDANSNTLFFPDLTITVAHIAAPKAETARRRRSWRAR